MNREVFGSIETITIPSLGIEVTAKVDTGAWSGALHCTAIREDNGVLSFAPLGDPALATSTTEFETREVRSASGHTERRYIISVELTIQGKSYTTMIGLSDRTLMHREMLLGRKFLLENNILVDVSLTVDDDKEAQDDL